jgi:type II secretory pathway component PulL
VPGKILGLDISEDSVTAVQVLSGLKGYQVTACAQVVIEDDAGLEGAITGLFEQMDLKSDTYLTSIPAENASYRNLQMPFKEPKKIRQTLPFEIETVVPFPSEDMVVDFAIIERADESEVLGVCVRKAYIAEYLRKLQANGIDPDVLDIRCVPTVSWLLKQEETPDNGLLLEIGPKRNLMILYLKRRIALIRTFAADGAPPASAHSEVSNNEVDTLALEEIESRLRRFCTNVQNTIHAFAWQIKKEIRPEKIFFTGPGTFYPETGNLLEEFLDIPVEQVNVRGNRKVRLESNVAKVWNPGVMDNALALALRDERQGQGFNFRKDAFEARKHYPALQTWIRKAALFLIIIFSLLAVDLGTDYYLLSKRYTALDQNIKETFRKTFPETKRIVDPVQQMRVKIKEMQNSTRPGVKANQGILQILRDISQRVPTSTGMNVTRLVVDPETVRMSGDTDTFNAVDTIKNRLEPSAYFSAVTITSANLDRTGKRVQFEIKLQRAE